MVKKGTKQVGYLISWKRGKNITVVCAFSASGMYVPPMFIFPRKRLNPLLGKGGPPGAAYRCSESGWINEELFFQYLKHFQNFVKPSLEDPVLLVMDNHTTHSTLQIYDFCKANGIVLLTIPPHTSHKLQPLDVTFYKSLKTGFNEECNKYLKCHPHQKITPFEVAELFNKAFMRVATPQKAVNGFEHTGIFPYNPDVFSPEDFTPAQIYKSHEPDIREAEESAEIIRHSSPELTLMGESIRHSTPEPTSSLVPGTSEHLSFTEMLPTPVAKNLGTRKNSKAVHSEIITSTPNKQNLILKEDRRLKKLERSKNKEKKLSSVKKQVFSNKESKLSTKQASSKMSHVDICLVCGEFGKNGELWLRCIICGEWAHKACTDQTQAHTQYICDHCC